MAINWLRVADYLDDQFFLLTREAERAGAATPAERASKRERGLLAQMLRDAIRAGLAEEEALGTDQDQALLCRIL